MHARPPEALAAPLRTCPSSPCSPTGRMRERERRHRRRSRPALRRARRRRAGANHYSADLGPFRLKWERHTEFTRYKFIVAGRRRRPVRRAGDRRRSGRTGWRRCPGEVIAAAHVALLPHGRRRRPSTTRIAGAAVRRQRAGRRRVAGGAAAAFTDFRIHADGFSRLLVHDRGMTPRQAGRTVQRLLEIDTYRILALLALPVAAELAPFLTRCEHELAEITKRLTGAARAGRAGAARPADPAGGRDREPRSATRISASAPPPPTTSWCGGASPSCARTGSRGCRPSASSPSGGWRPAMATCRAVPRARRPCPQRVARATQLLSTRVEITRERQNQAVLASMNRRAQAAAAAAADRRGPLGGGDHLLRGRAGRLRRQGR